MAANWKTFTVSGLLVTAIILCLSGSLCAAERIVILAPAAADVLERLGAGGSIVGVTNSVSGFPSAAKVGTHLHPGVEKVASLKPDLIVATPRFNPELAARMGAELFVYAPETLDEVVHAVRLLANATGRAEQGTTLAEELQAVLDGLHVPQHRPTVLYETRSNPLAIAHNASIIKDLLERAGMRYAYPRSTGALSAEYLLANQPEYYLYQDGPMNKNPAQPSTRPGWERFRACAWKVDEFAFARPNTQLFETVRVLNELITMGATCEQGAGVFR